MKKLIFIFCTISLLTLVGCKNEARKENEITLPATEIEQYVDKEFGVTCYEHYRSYDISCINSIPKEPTDFKEKPITELDRYIDTNNGVVCYQSHYRSRGLSCVKYQKL